jgi:hypothetical protein
MLAAKLLFKRTTGASRYAFLLATRLQIAALLKDSTP